MRRSSKLSILLLTLALGACGTRGPLYLPPAPTKPAPTPISTPTAAATPADLNTVKDPAQ